MIMLDWAGSASLCFRIALTRVRLCLLVTPQKYTSLVDELKKEIEELNHMVESLTEEKVQLEARLLEEVSTSR